MVEGVLVSGGGGVINVVRVVILVKAETGGD